MGARRVPAEVGGLAGRRPGGGREPAEAPRAPAWVDRGGGDGGRAGGPAAGRRGQERGVWRRDGAGWRRASALTTGPASAASSAACPQQWGGSEASRAPRQRRRRGAPDPSGLSGAAAAAGGSMPARDGSARRGRGRGWPGAAAGGTGLALRQPSRLPGAG